MPQPPHLQYVMSTNFKPATSGMNVMCHMHKFLCHHVNRLFLQCLFFSSCYFWQSADTSYLCDTIMAPIKMELILWLVKFIIIIIGLC